MASEITEQVDGKPIPALGAPEQTPKWFNKLESVTIPPQARELLETYSKIPPDEVEETVISLRDRAWEVYPYPCIGLFRFLDLDLYARKDVYPRLLSRLKGEEDCKFLDVGCCLGQDIRKLRFDGVPGERLFGAEINNGFIDLGYQLFRDRDTLGAKIMVADISDDQGLLSGYAGKFDVVHLGRILHLFSWEEQVDMFRHVIRLLKDGKLGTTILGHGLGHLGGVQAASQWQENHSHFEHNVESFGRLMGEIERATGSKWDVKAELVMGMWDDSTKNRTLFFELTRLG